jgi:hypothetical protein
MNDRKPPPWPVRALIVGGFLGVMIPVTGAILACTVTRDAVNIILGRPLNHRPKCQCWHCGKNKPPLRKPARLLTPHEEQQWRALIEKEFTK